MLCGIGTHFYQYATYEQMITNTCIVQVGYYPLSNTALSEEINFEYVTKTNGGVSTALSYFALPNYNAGSSEHHPAFTRLWFYLQSTYSVQYRKSRQVS